MVSQIKFLLTLSSVIVAASCASIMDNSVYETPRIRSSDELIMSIVNNCFERNTMSCLKGKVLTYLDTYLGMDEEQARSFSDKNVDNVIYDRVGKILSSNEIKLQLPKTIFQNAVVSYRADRGLDIDLPQETQEEARGDVLKKKLLLPVLLLLKLKMKALMPIFVAIIGLKATKALILSKLAITLVLGFIIYNLIKAKKMDMPMTMTPMMPADTMAYGAPAPTSAPASSYDPSWEPNTGGPYSRVWEPSSSSSSGSNLAYSSYYPSSSSSSSGSSSSSSSTSTGSLSGSSY